MPTKSLHLLGHFPSKDATGSHRKHTWHSPCMLQNIAALVSVSSVQSLWLTHKFLASASWHPASMRTMVSAMHNMLLPLRRKAAIGGSNRIATCAPCGVAVCCLSERKISGPNSTTSWQHAHDNSDCRHTFQWLSLWHSIWSNQRLQQH